MSGLLVGFLHADAEPTNQVTIGIFSLAVQVLEGASRAGKNDLVSGNEISLIGGVQMRERFGGCGDRENSEGEVRESHFD